MIFHIISRSECDAARSAGTYKPASLATEGFVHCSTREQIVETANLFYKGRRDLVLLCIEEKKLVSPLKFEAPAAGPTRSSKRFPHIYGLVNLDAVVSIIDFPCAEDGLFTLPGELGRS